MTIDPLSVSLISLDHAVARLAAADREVDGDLAVAHYRKRERAIARLYEALCNDALIALGRDPVSGALIRLIGHNWQGAAFWRDTIVGGNVRTQPGEDMALYDGWSVVLERSEFERWAEASPAVEPAVDRTRKGTIGSKRADDAIRDALRSAYKEAMMAGKKPPSKDQACRIAQPLVHKLGFSVSRDDIRYIASEGEFAAMRLKRGQRPKKK
jgi:hypothetical protein